MTRSSSTGASDDYTVNDEAGLADAVDEGLQNSSPGGGKRTVTVTAQVEWSGEKHGSGPNGRRTVQFTDVTVGKVQAATDARREAESRAGRARVFTSYQAKGWKAQLRELTRTKSGSAAADRVGLDPTARTLSRWLSGGTPSSANQAKISQAYEAVRTRDVTAADNALAAANHAVAEAVTEALNNAAGGADIRIRDITRFDVT